MVRTSTHSTGQDRLSRKPPWLYRLPLAGVDRQPDQPFKLVEISYEGDENMRSKFRFLCTLLAFSLLFSFASARNDALAEREDLSAQSRYVLKASVFGAGGSFGRSEHYATAGTLGQSTPIGIGSPEERMFLAGFWGRYLKPPAVEEIPATFGNMLFQNFPNPFNPLTTIEYSVAKASPVELTIYDIRGQGVRTLVRENKLAGKYAAAWDGKNDGGRPISTGVYFCRLKIGSFASVKKMVLLK